MNTANLTMTLLGSVQIRQGETAVSGLASRKAEALFIYLACNPRPHSRDSLAALLWPENDQQRALANLSVALSSLRKQVDAYLLTDWYTIAFNTETNFWLDVAAFEQAIAQARARQQANGKLTRTAAAALQTAVSYYHGDFLAGYYLRNTPEFEAWVLLEQERLRQLVLAALGDLITFYDQRGQLADSISYTHRLLALDPLQEEARRQLMALYARSDQRTQAIQQYEQLVALLDAELGVAPAADTTALYEQITAGEWPSTQPETPPQRGAAVPPPPQHNLPTAVTSFVGRDAELAQINDWLARPNARLLTLTGPGGIGKTRLAQEAARVQVGAFADGVWSVSLTPVNDVPGMVTAVANALAFSFSGPTPPRQQLLAHLRGQEMLLLLDNFEHLLSDESVTLMMDFIQQMPESKLLITSRERLHVQAETVLELNGLPYPSTAHAAVETPIDQLAAVRLFVRRAARQKSDFVLAGQEAAVTQLCQQVDGMPLALELAATWVRALALPEIVAEIAGGIDFLAAHYQDIPLRHRSMRAVFDYSWALLTPLEQAVFRQLSVCRGGFTRAAAAAVAEAPLAILAALVDKSLLRLDGDGRYRRHPLLIQYAADQLAQHSSEQGAAQQRHAFFFAKFLQEMNDHWAESERQQTVHLIAAEQENCRVMWQWAVSASNEAILHQSYLCLHAYFVEGRQLFDEWLGWLETAVAHWQHRADAEANLLLARLYNGAANTLTLQGHLSAARVQFAQSLALCRRIDHQRGVAANLSVLAMVQSYLGEQQAALDSLTECIAIEREMGNQEALAISLAHLGSVLAHMDVETAETHLQESLRLARAANLPRPITIALNNLADLLMRQGRLAEAAAAVDEALTLSKAIGDRGGVGLALLNRMVVAGRQRNLEAAEADGRQALGLLTQYGSQVQVAEAWHELGHVAFAQEKWAQAEENYRQAIAMNKEGHYLPYLLQSLSSYGRLAAAQGRTEEAVRLLAYTANHPAAWEETRRTAAQQLTSLAPHFAPDPFEALVENGRAADLNTLYDQLFGG